MPVVRQQPHGALYVVIQRDKPELTALSSLTYYILWDFDKKVFYFYFIFRFV